MVLKRATRFAGRNLAKLAGHDPDKLLFRGNDGLFVEAMAACTVYAEYGCGASTIWCANNTTVPIIAVDSSAQLPRELQRAVLCSEPQQKWHAAVAAIQAQPVHPQPLQLVLSYWERHPCSTDGMRSTW